MTEERMKMEFEPDEKFVDAEGNLRESAYKALLDMTRTEGWQVLKMLLEQDKVRYAMSVTVPLSEGLAQGYSLETLAVMRDYHLAKRRALVDIEAKVDTLVDHAKEQESK